MENYRALRELTVSRTKEFFREPEAVFWVYIFPLLLMIGLGVAFRGGSKRELHIDVAQSTAHEETARVLRSRDDFVVEVVPLARARARYAAGKVDLIVRPTGEGCEYIYDPSRMGAEAARLRVDHAIQTSAGRTDPVPWSEAPITEPGSRYIDWLIPGLLGLNIMGGGLWGLGFVTVDLRMRKLLKRFVATPMRKSDFLLSLIISRLLFMMSEMAVILIVGHLLFGLVIHGSLLSVLVLSFLGAICFSGLGLLIACRADKIETISGLLNLVMLPMWLLSGVFFSAERFPGVMQPFVQALPLTQLNNGLRAIILEGMPLGSLWLPALVLTLFAFGAFFLALRWFRWN